MVREEGAYSGKNLERGYMRDGEGRWDKVGGGPPGEGAGR